MTKNDVIFQAGIEQLGMCVERIVRDWYTDITVYYKKPNKFFGHKEYNYCRITVTINPVLGSSSYSMVCYGAPLVNENIKEIFEEIYEVKMEKFKFVDNDPCERYGYRFF